MKRLRLLFVLLLAIIIAPVANALIQGEADNTVNVNQDYDDTAIFAGNIVTVNSNIDGLNFSAGNSLNISGSSDYGFIAGNSINITNYKTKDLYVAGSTIAISNTEARAVYAAGNVITIQSHVSAVYIGGNDVTLEGEFGDVIVECNKFTLKGKITGTLKINEEAERNIEENTVTAIETYKGHRINKATIDQYGIKFLVGYIVGKVIAKLFHLANILIIGFLFILLFKKTMKNIDKLKTGPGFVFSRFGIGLGLLIGIPIIGIVFLVSILASALGLIGLTLYGIAIYMSEILVITYTGKKMFSKMNIYLSYFIVALVMTLIKIIPIIGGLLGFFTLCLGLGIAANLVLNEIKGK